MKSLWHLFIYGLFWCMASCFLGGCSESDHLEENRKDQSSWEIIQTQIWDKNCTSCHAAGTSFARQSDLILTADKAYVQLVDRAPKNQAAKNDGLLLVGNNGLQSLYNSFLWEKVNFPDFEHFYSDHPDYGELMPFGGPSLTHGELRFISEWIIAGAPDTGVVVDAALLEDTMRFKIPNEAYTILDPPLQGLQLNLGPFEVWPQAERELFYYETLDNATPLYINKVEISMRAGSHHFILYDYEEGTPPEAEVYRDFWNSEGDFNIGTAASILNQRFVFGTQWRFTSYEFPEGVALKIPANSGFDMNSHYVNRTFESKMGEVTVNLHTIPPGEAIHIAQNLFENYTDILLPPNQVTTLTRQSLFNERMHIFQLTSHAHEHMTEFKIFIIGGDRDGELVYFTNDWEHPPLLRLDPPLILEPGQGLRSEATYNNDTNRTLRFGLQSQDEMMIGFGAFYIE